MSSEEIRSLIKLAMGKEDYTKVCELLETYPYDDGEDLVAVWDDAHYLQKFACDRKPLTPLIRFRIRQRYPPPRSILPSGQRKGNALPDSARDVLECWYGEHRQHPYPTPEEKAQLSKRTGLTMTQIRTWFANLRRRVKKKQSQTAVGQKGHGAVNRIQAYSGAERKHTLIKNFTSLGTKIDGGSLADRSQYQTPSTAMQARRESRQSAFIPLLPKEAGKSTPENVNGQKLLYDSNQISLCVQQVPSPSYQGMPKEYFVYHSLQSHWAYQPTVIPTSSAPVPYHFRPIGASSGHHQPISPLAPAFNMPTSTYTHETTTVTTSQPPPAAATPSQKSSHAFSANGLTNIEEEAGSPGLVPVPQPVSVAERARMHKTGYTSPPPAALPPEDLLNLIPHSLCQASTGEHNFIQNTSFQQLMSACAPDLEGREGRIRTEKPRSARELNFRQSDLDDIQTGKQNCDMDSLEAARILITLPEHCP